MQLNIDLIRDILLKTELGSFKFSKKYNNWDEDKEYNYSKSKDFPNYLNIEVEYHLNFLKEVELLILELKYGTYEIFDLTVKGHSFVSNIRNIENWNKIKDISNNVGSSSIETLIKISEKLISELIDKQINQYQ